MYVTISQKKFSYTIFDKKNDKKQNERKSWELTVCNMELSKLVFGDNFCLLEAILLGFLQDFQDYRKSSNRCNIDNTTSSASIWSAHTLNGHKTASTYTIKIDIQVFLPTML